MICDCHLTKPTLYYIKNNIKFEEIVPTPTFIVKRKRQELMKCNKLSRNYFENLNNRFNYKFKQIINEKLLFDLHKNKMQETFYIIKRMNCHTSSKMKCQTNNLNYQCDKYNYVIYITFPTRPPPEIKRPISPKRRFINKYCNYNDIFEESKDLCNTTLCNKENENTISNTISNNNFNGSDLSNYTDIKFIKCR